MTEQFYGGATRDEMFSTMKFILQVLAIRAGGSITITEEDWLVPMNGNINIEISGDGKTCTVSTYPLAEKQQ